MKGSKPTRLPQVPEMVMLGALPKGATVNIPEVKVRNYKSTAKPMEVADNPTIKQMADFLRSKVLVKGEITTQEFGMVLFLNRAGKVIGYWKQAMGAVSSVLFEQRLIFSAAIQSLSSSIVLSHNHPSGTVGASQADLLVTADFVKMGKILGIPIADHIIVTENGYYSFFQNGLIGAKKGNKRSGNVGETLHGASDPTDTLRLEIKRHLAKCDGSRTPRTCKRIATKEGYLQVEALIIGMCLRDPISIQTAIANLESVVL